MAAETFSIEIDGRNCSTQTGEMVLAVAQRNDIFIPALCAHPLLQPYGACRLCLVEIEVRKRQRIVASCAFPVQAGLVVRTSTAKIDELRRGIMELLLARCPDSAPLRELAARLGVKSTRFPTLAPAGENCILCGLCVRVCNEIAGPSGISFAGRGVDRHVDSPFALGAENCLGCCACAALCPTGSVTVECGADALRLGKFKTEVKMGHCMACGKPVAAVPLQELVRSQAVLPLIAANLCPDCKAQRRAETLAAITTQRIHTH